jgi:hypothetical protein
MTAQSAMAWSKLNAWQRLWLLFAVVFLASTVALIALVWPQGGARTALIFVAVWAGFIMVVYALGCSSVSIARRLPKRRKADDR